MPLQCVAARTAAALLVARFVDLRSQRAGAWLARISQERVP